MAQKLGSPLHEHFLALLSSTRDFWARSDLEEKVLFLVVATLVVFAAYAAYRWAKWRFVNRNELRKQVHYANIRMLFEEASRVDALGHTVLQSSRRDFVDQEAS